MAIRNLRYGEDEILKKRAREVEVVDEKIRELVQDMIETMHKYDGVGLAAPQVGILKRVIVIDLYEEGQQYVVINPVIKKAKGEQIVEEGCLSFPNQFGKVRRPKSVVVEGLDLNGKKQVIKGENLLAQALCHEIDHLNGEVFIDKVEEGSLEVITPKELEERRKQNS